jgi:hypothetical protein
VLRQKNQRLSRNSSLIGAGAPDTNTFHGSRMNAQKGSLNADTRSQLPPILFLSAAIRVDPRPNSPLSFHVTSNYMNIAG